MAQQALNRDHGGSISQHVGGATLSKAVQRSSGSYASGFPCFLGQGVNVMGLNCWQWREELPFLYVQLANFTAHSEDEFDGPWARFRESQHKVLRVPHTGMVTTIDIGDPDSIHPMNKLDVGVRLVKATEKVAYGNEDCIYVGPTFKQLKFVSNKIELSFDHIGSGLMSKGDEIKGFAVAGRDKVFKWAQAEIKGSKVFVWNDTIEQPEVVQYAYSNCPVASLYNKEGLPAVPFRVYGMINK